MTKEQRATLALCCELAAWFIGAALLFGVYLVLIDKIPSVEDARPSGGGLWRFVTNWTACCAGSTLVLGLMGVASIIDPKDDRGDADTPTT